MCILRKMIQVQTLIFSHQILSSLTKLQRHRRPASEQDRFLSSVKTGQILQFTRYDLKKTFLSAPTITKLKIWRSQFLLRYLVESNKCCQLSAYGPYYANLSHFLVSYVLIICFPVGRALGQHWRIVFRDKQKPFNAPW